MIYINSGLIEDAGINWSETMEVIENTVHTLAENDFAQPIKPYLRYRNMENRIIAMPAFIGGKYNKAGIKWISSFPGNLSKGIPRAHSVIILNEVETGKPEAVFNTPLLSIIRTASVSGVFAKNFLEARKLSKVNIGIIGFGPIGIHHYKLFSQIFAGVIDKVFLYDIRGIERSKYAFLKDNVEIVNSWQEAYHDSDIFMTCTVSKAPYIDEKPKAGSLQLNVSLRDYKDEIYEYVKSSVFVDDWMEACRENTDIERLHLNKGLSEKQTYSIQDAVYRNAIESIPSDVPVMFNPMGMAVFDISIASYYLQKINDRNIGIALAD